MYIVETKIGGDFLEGYESKQEAIRAIQSDKTVYEFCRQNNVVLDELFSLGHIDVKQILLG